MPSLPAALPCRLNPPNRFLTPAPNLRTCTKPSRMVKKMPVPHSRNSKRLFHKKSLTALTAWVNASISFPLTFRKMPPVKAECSKLCAIQIQMPAHRTLGASIPCFCGKVKCARRAAAAQKMPRRRAGWGRAARFGRAARKGGERTPGARRAGKSAGGKKVRRGPKGRKWGWDYKTRPAGRRCAARRYCPPGCR